MKFLPVIFISIVFLSACKNEPVQQEEQSTDLPKSFQIIKTAQDNRDLQSIIPFMIAKKENDRMVAAEAMASLQDSAAVPHLCQSIQADRSPLVREKSAYALGQIRDTNAVTPLIKAFMAESNVNTQRIMLHALGKLANHQVATLFKNFEPEETILKEGLMYGIFQASMAPQSDLFVTPFFMEKIVTMAHEINTHIGHYYAVHYIKRSRGAIQPMKMKPLIYGYKHKLTDTNMIYHLEVALDMHENQITKPAVPGSPYDISTLQGEDLTSLKLIALDTSSHVFRSYSAADEYYKNANSNQQKVFTKRLLKTNNYSLISRACYFIHENPEVFKRDVEVLEDLQGLSAQLTKADEVESYLDVVKAMNLLGLITNPRKNNFHEPIDWDYFYTLKEVEKVEVVTSKGSMIFECYPLKATGSVIHFLKLVDEGFYSNKSFHRVVPHFVIQGGCPRGDGWGSLDWTQRSEFVSDLRYEEGSVGLASAGKDTEGVQWFVTHEPTPHLDGRYTIFAKVVQGLDVIHKVVPGDQILEVKRID